MRQMLRASSNEARSLFIDSLLKYCQISRACGNSDDLHSALSKIGVLEQKFEGTPYFDTVVPAALAERAEILWKRNEKMEAVETLHSLISTSQRLDLSFSLSPKELVFATLVFLLRILYGLRSRHHGPQNCV